MFKAAHDINADLHAHSTVSDGTLAPGALVQRAVARGIEIFALTDHDELSGLEEAAAEAHRHGLRFVHGVEVSVTFAGQTVHILGFGVDPANAELRAGLQLVRSGRMRRAQAMAEGLAAVGIEGALDGALRYADNLDLVSRMHFARWLVESGACSDTREVFGRYLVAGKPGYVPHQWAKLGEAIAWIRGAGGVAAIAHPGRYKLNDTELWALATEFKEAGGTALEVVTSNHNVAETRRFADMAREFGFEASRGSDFHGPAESHAELGSIANLPLDLVPVWHRFL
ncbi:MAG TPA: 3',5'-nucleoside bisphosphate phosphatase [Burkholderiaceae bacterium]|nr:3',5'-nucleoside bisphosphate phosphatase [Burkholderiaceae bacterium]